MIPRFEYDPIKPIKVMRRAAIKAKKIIIERIIAFICIVLTVIGGWITIIWGILRFLQSIRLID